MANLFGSPFSSQVGQRIETATDNSRPSEDWTLILEICDIINETDEGPKDAIKALRKRLSSHKNPKSVLYALTVAEACVKNCGPRFHKQIATKEFMGDLTKLLEGHKRQSNLPEVVQEKILSLIQSWADAFRNAPELHHIKNCYDSLRADGYEFPAQDLDKLSPIFTPTRLSDNPPPHPSSGTNPPGTRAPTNARPQTAPVIGSRNFNRSSSSSGPINPSPEQLAKLRSELDIVEGNVRVLNDMLTELQPGQENSDDYELLVELNKTCREMQRRLVALLERIASEEVTGVLLRINDDLNNVFIRYDRYDRNRKAVTGQVTQPPPQQPQSPQRTLAIDTRTTGESSLIEFTDNNTTNPSNQEDDEFDMFAQSRGTTFAASRIAGSTYEDNREGVPNEESLAGVMSSRGPYPKIDTSPEQFQQKELDDDIEDVEKWLQGTSLEEMEKQDREAQDAEARKNAPPPRSVQTSENIQPTMTSTEFDNFLSQRAMLGSNSALSTLREPAQQMTNVAGDRKADEMFAL